MNVHILLTEEKFYIAPSYLIGRNLTAFLSKISSFTYPSVGHYLTGRTYCNYTENFIIKSRAQEN